MADNCWLTSIVVDEDLLAAESPDALLASLAAGGIEARHLWKPMHLQPVFSHNRAFTNGASEALFARGLNLPTGVGLSDDDIDRVIDSVCSALGVKA